ncbi:MAG: bifunctional diguanylate cyclase/phosphodiesterase [Xanthobacteraceae bacterium]
MSTDDNPPGAPFDPAQILAAVGEGAYDWRIDTDIVLWGNNAAEVLLVRDPAAISTGRGYAQILDAENAQGRFDAVMQSNKRDDGHGVAYQIQYGIRPDPASETKLWVEDTGRWFAGPDGKPQRALGVIRVINERYEQERQLTFLGRYDGLTGELNRHRLTELLEDTIEEALRFRSSCGFLLVAIDHLARINESYGFDIADEVIRIVAKRLRSRMRGKDTLGRISGNKFGLVLRDCTPDDMAIAAERMLAGVRDDMVPTAAGPIAVTVTIGGITAPRHARSVTEALSRAQGSLEAARARRRGSFMAYRPSVERETMRRESVRATDEIVAALNERRIFLAYETVASAADRKPAFYECLMRIRRADGSLMAANEISPVAERLGLVRLLDFRVLELVIEELVGAPGLNASLNVSPASTIDPDWWSGLTSLLRSHSGAPGLNASLNVSSASTIDPDWWSGLTSLLRSHSGAPERLIVEITESDAILNIEETRGFVARVKDLGCRIAIDDFGAGYTSFRNLRQLGVDIVKIDGAFVRDIITSDDDRAFVRSLIELAQRLKLKTVAEWVQDEEAAKTLRDWGCDYLQGALTGLASA